MKDHLGHLTDRSESDSKLSPACPTFSLSVSKVCAAFGSMSPCL